MTGDLSLLMVRADDHEPLVEGMTEDAVVVGTASDEQPGHLWDEGRDPNDLVHQRWGVIAPQGPRGDRLLAILEPLVALRRAQQHGEPVRVHRVPPRMTQSEALRWKKQVFAPGTDLDLEVPRYQLIVGDLHEVPLTLQQAQSSDGYVGRVAFDDDEDLEAYVDKVLRWEARAAPQREGRAIFYTVHDRSGATTAGYEGLVRPCLEAARQRLERGQFNADRIVEAGPSRVGDPSDLRVEANADRPGVLLSLSHGEGPPRAGWPSADHQRRCQGAMSFGRRGQLRGEDVATGSFLPGGVWLMMACFGAGSPQTSAYLPWLEALKARGRFGGEPAAVLDALPAERPFVAWLPQRVLANPDGPLGFVGHVDLAWTYAFRELDDGAPRERPGKMMAVLRSLLERNRFGLALRELHRYFDRTNAELTALERDAKSGRIPADDAWVARRSHLWMLREDLSAYVLLGDPAARLPLHHGAAPVRAAEPPRRPAIAGLPRASGRQRLPLPIDELEQAIGAVLLGDDGLRTIAERHGLPREVLRELYERYSAGGRAALGVDDDD
ncbi:hypothetical protein [Paraliomyxa miuraensis]|uniref:hypothetical protein n=1 Tax=Paraliomyxa miuraensis TaxID=376150 RepID=UPI0022505E05|nr:hypothetical protein [Paraliomyxa miuraensis]MCX4241457.1 hypothetical protein [Paraliomyxa miuraensis]